MAEDWNAVPKEFMGAIVDADEIFNRDDEEIGLGKLPKKNKKKHPVEPRAKKANTK